MIFRDNRTLNVSYLGFILGVRSFIAYVIIEGLGLNY